MNKMDDTSVWVKRVKDWLESMGIYEYQDALYNTDGILIQFYYGEEFKAGILIMDAIYMEMWVKPGDESCRRWSSSFNFEDFDLTDTDREPSDILKPLEDTLKAWSMEYRDINAVAQA